MVATHKNHLKENSKILVFLHYFGGSEQSWKWVIDELEDDYRCIALNLPGFGKSLPLKNPSIESLAQYIQKELEFLKITNYVLVGHSMGSKIAFQIAANASEGHIEQLILIAPSPPGIEPIAEDEKHRMLNHPNLEEAIKTAENITKTPLSDAQHQLVVENNLIADNTTWRWWLNDGMNNSIQKQAKRLKLPITILNSQDDPVMTPQIIKERVMTVLPEAKLITTGVVGHLIPMENPLWVAEQIRNVLATQS